MGLFPIVYYRNGNITTVPSPPLISRDIAKIMSYTIHNNSDLEYKHCFNISIDPRIKNIQLAVAFWLS
jgi:hypothetical protein